MVLLRLNREFFWVGKFKRRNWRHIYLPDGIIDRNQVQEHFWVNQINEMEMLKILLYYMFIVMLTTRERNGEVFLFLTQKYQNIKGVGHYMVTLSLWFTRDSYKNKAEFRIPLHHLVARFTNNMQEFPVGCDAFHVDRCFNLQSITIENKLLNQFRKQCQKKELYLSQDCTHNKDGKPPCSCPSYLETEEENLFIQQWSSELIVRQQ
ncbi:MAG: hypothetical protein EZS28_026671 [Streblomastix strix]|uniref:Uncharacterized protein n=1 Tax=Streblomastix strix TaxID=222440 RepID=A0A5J4V5Y9_9EUKA|nr:MAG: hypothetical protein EZS28_026671 [Streblomastix strix]